jgi:hypothetical protein
MSIRTGVVEQMNAKAVEPASPVVAAGDGPAG